MKMENESKRRTLRERVHSLFREDDVFWNNEIRANIFVCMHMYVIAGILLLVYILVRCGVLDASEHQLSWILYINIPLMIAAAVLTNIFHGQKHWIKYMLCIVILFIATGLSATLDFMLPLIIAVPVILSVRYYSKKLTVTMAGLSMAGMIVAELLYARHGVLNLNLLPVAEGTVLTVGAGGLKEAAKELAVDWKLYTEALFRGALIPKLLIYNIIAFICVELSQRARKMVLEQSEVSHRTEAMQTELSMATRIQEGMLPHIFPPFPEREDFTIYASMDPAKEVGGDFYDFYFLDDDHLLLLVADVSGKGVPAALFMMASKILIKSCAGLCRTPGRIASEINRQLTADNPAEMFVTAWIGVAELSTGKLTYADCGHEYPVIFRKETGSYEFLKGNKGMPIGFIEGAEYRESETTLLPEDLLFLYTDGVPETNDTEGKLFGRNRLLKLLEENKPEGAEEILELVKKETERFANGAAQFDDMTMLAFKKNR